MDIDLKELSSNLSFLKVTGLRVNINVVDYISLVVFFISFDFQLKCIVVGLCLI